VYVVSANAERLFVDRIDGLPFGRYMQSTENNVREIGAWAQSKLLRSLS